VTNQRKNNENLILQPFEDISWKGNGKILIVVPSVAFEAAGVHSSDKENTTGTNQMER